MDVCVLHIPELKSQLVAITTYDVVSTPNPSQTMQLRILKQAHPYQNKIFNEGQQIRTMTIQDTEGFTVNKQTSNVDMRLSSSSILHVGMGQIS